MPREHTVTIRIKKNKTSFLMEYSIKLENLVSPGVMDAKTLSGSSKELVIYGKTLQWPLLMMAKMQTQIRNP